MMMRKRDNDEGNDDDNDNDMKLMEIVRGLFDLYSRERFNYSLRIYCYNLKPIFKFDL